MATANDIITDVRDLIGDPVYDVSGNPQPSVDGTFLRAQTILRWINQAQAILGQALGGMEDWTAIPGVLYQDVYPLDPRFFEVKMAYYDGMVMAGPPEVTEDMITAQNILTGTSMAWSINATVPVLKMRLWPAAGRTPGSTTLAAGISAAATSLTGVSSANFGISTGGPAFGWLNLDGTELVRYQQLTVATNVFSVLTRGLGGTKPVAHLIGGTVQECNIWIKGTRLPTPVGIWYNTTLNAPNWQTGSQQLLMSDQLEIPDYYFDPIVSYCLHRAKLKESDEEAAGFMLKAFDARKKEAGEAKRRPRVGQARLPGQGPGLWCGRVIIR